MNGPAAPSRQLRGRPIGGIALGTALPSLSRMNPDDFMRTVHAALDAGVRVLDGAAAYVPDAASAGFNERAIAQAVRSWDGPQHEVVHVTKVGHRRIADGPAGLIVDGRPKSILADIVRASRAADVERLDLVLLHMPDPAVPIEESFAALAQAQREGLVRDIGLSNVRRHHLDAVRSIGTVAAVENQYSFQPHRILDDIPVTRHESDPVLRWCGEAGAVLLAYSPLGGSRSAVRALGTRFPAVAAAAHRLGVSPVQVALAWLIALDEALLPVVGASRPVTITDSARAWRLILDREQSRAIAAELFIIDSDTSVTESSAGYARHEVPAERLEAPE